MVTYPLTTQPMTNHPVAPIQLPPSPNLHSNTYHPPGPGDPNPITTRTQWSLIKWLPSHQRLPTHRPPTHRIPTQQRFTTHHHIHHLIQSHLGDLFCLAISVDFKWLHYSPILCMENVLQTCSDRQSTLLDLQPYTSPPIYVKSLKVCLADEAFRF